MYIIPPLSVTYISMEDRGNVEHSSKKRRILPNCPFDCKRGCMRCIGPLTELQNLIIYVTSKEWEHRVAKYLAQAPERGHKMIIHHHDARILCRIVEVKLVDDESDAALYTVRWPPNTSDLKPGEKMEIREGVRRKYLEFRRPRFPRRWEEWLVKKLNLVEGGVAEIPWRRETMRVQMKSQLAALTSGTTNDILEVHRGGAADTR
mmetsp:Transcript_10487/g.13801  ORF Transcript_10487/g.13801 Transcript_10487/m.13801 type:complete len:205 (-) Transcript_10487:194-808(-)